MNVNNVSGPVFRREVYRPRGERQFIASDSFFNTM